MNLFTIIGEALRALRQNRLRTGLTMLGMIIGVAAVVLMLSIGQGAQTKINQTIAEMGSNLLSSFQALRLPADLALVAVVSEL